MQMLLLQLKQRSPGEYAVKRDQIRTSDVDKEALECNRTVNLKLFIETKNFIFGILT